MPQDPSYIAEKTDLYPTIKLCIMVAKHCRYKFCMSHFLHSVCVYVLCLRNVLLWHIGCVLDHFPLD